MLSVKEIYISVPILYVYKNLISQIGVMNWGIRVKVSSTLISHLGVVRSLCHGRGSRGSEIFIKVCNKENKEN